MQKIALNPAFVLGHPLYCDFYIGVFLIFHDYNYFYLIFYEFIFYDPYSNNIYGFTSTLVDEKESLPKAISITNLFRLALKLDI